MTGSPHRQAVAVAAGLLALTALVGCRASHDEPVASGSSDDAAFPVTIEHTFGSTTINSRPERIVTLGYSAQDVVYALGLTPVGMPSYSSGANEDGVMPWVEEYYDPAETTLIDESDGLPLEKIAALTPDVILAPYHGIYKSEYEKLTEIAPTVAYPDGPFQTPWPELTRMVGDAVGMPTEAEQLIDDTETFLRKTGREYPALQGSTLSVTYMGAQAIDVYMPTVAMVDMLVDMGMTPSEGEEALAAEDKGENFSVPLSWENVSDIDADVIVSFIDDLSEEQVVDDKPTGDMSAFKNDSVVYLADPGVTAAFVFPSVLSIPATMKIVVPDIAAAAERSGSGS